MPLTRGAISEPAAGAPADDIGLFARRHLLALRFALVNVVAFALVAATWFHGWLDGALVGYTRWLTLAIFAVFGYGLVLCTLKVWWTTRAIESVRTGAAPLGAGPLAVLGRVDVHEDAGAALLRMRLLNRIAVVRHVAESLVFLGLVGTVIGFIVALSGVDPEQAASVESIAPMVATLIEGMSIALYTTLIGAVLHVWLMVDYRMLSSGTLALFGAAAERRDAHVGG